MSFCGRLATGWEECKLQALPDKLLCEITLMIYCLRDSRVLSQYAHSVDVVICYEFRHILKLKVRGFIS